MTVERACTADSRQHDAERYASGHMNAGDAAAFEDHFVECADCQAEVRFASAVAAGVRHNEPVLPSARDRRRWWIPAGVLAAAAVATVTAIQLRPDPNIVALGHVVTAPAYLGVAVRGAPQPVESQFDAAMDAYARHQYLGAADKLRATLAAGGDSIPGEFFLGVSLLLSDRPADAEVAFAHTIARGKTPYAAEAHYYRAKALLQKSRVAEARAELAALTTADGIVHEMGVALADSVTRVTKR